MTARVGSRQGISRRWRQAGFSLVELMIAMVMGLLIILALATLLINVNRNNTEMARTNSVIENGRFALQLLETDISHSGFWGGFIPQFDDLSASAAPADAPTAIPDPCLAYSVANWNDTYKAQMIGMPIQVYEVSSGGTAPTIGTCAANSPNPVANAKANTHVLVVRHAAPCAASSTATDEDCTKESGDLYFQLGRCTSPVSYLFEAAADATLSNFTLKKRVSSADCTSTVNTDIYKFVSHIYYIRDYSVSAGDGIPTLMRSTFKVSGGVPKFVASDALIEGVEGFRVELGVDSHTKPTPSNPTGTTLLPAHFTQVITWTSNTLTRDTPTNRGDGTPDTFVQCTGASPCSALDLMNTVSVKLYVLVRALNKTPNYTDTKTYTLGSSAGAMTFTPSGGNVGYKRHLYTQAIRLTNISMRREVPP